MNQISDELKARVLTISRLLKVMWAGQFFTLGIFVFVAVQACSKGAEPEASPIIPFFLAMAAFAILLFFVLNALLLSPRAIVAFHRKKSIFRVVSAMKKSGRNPLMGGDPPENLTEQEQVLFDYSSLIFHLQLILWGMLNTAALLGMLLSLITHQMIYSYALTSVVAVILLFRFPNVERLLNNGLVELLLVGPNSDR